MQYRFESEFMRCRTTSQTAYVMNMAHDVKPRPIYRINRLLQRNHRRLSHGYMQAPLTIFYDPNDKRQQAREAKPYTASDHPYFHDI